MNRRRLVVALLLVAMGIGGVFVARLGVRTAVAGALLDLHRHERLDARYADLGFGAGAAGFGVAGLELEDASGRAIGRVEEAALRPGLVVVDGRRRPGLVLDIRGARVDADALRRWQSSLPSKKRPPFQTARRALRTLRRNFSGAHWELRLHDVAVDLECGTLEIGELRVAGRSPSAVSLRVDVAGDYDWQGPSPAGSTIRGGADVLVYRDAVVLEGRVAENAEDEPGSLTGRLPAPAWAASLPPHLELRDANGASTSLLDAETRLCKTPPG